MSAASHPLQLAEIRSQILNQLLNDHDLVDALLHHPQAPLPHLAAIAQLQAAIALLHAADLADILEALPQDERLALWHLIDDDRRGQVLVEASETVWESLTEEMSDKAILRALAPLDIDDQAYLAKYLPRDLTGRLLASLDPAQRAHVVNMMHFDRDRVGRIMDFSLLTVRDDVSLATVQRFLRRKKVMPDGTDKLFITDKQNRLLGELPLTAILLNTPDKQVAEVMNARPTTFRLMIKQKRRQVRLNVIT